MNPTSTIAKALAACLMVSCCLEAAGQDLPPSGQPGREAAVQPLIDLKFSGGSAADYARVVQQAAPHVNILVAPEAADVLMPAVELKSVAVGTALELLDGLTGAHSRIGAIKLDVHHIRSAPQDQGIYQIAARIMGGRAPAPSRKSGVVSIADIVGEHLGAEDVLSAVAAALDMLPDSVQPPVLRYHQETRLLIARGTGEQLEVINDVIVAARQSKELAGYDRVQVAEAESELMQWKTKTELLLAEIKSLRRAQADRDQMLASFRNEIAALKAELGTLKPR